MFHHLSPLLLWESSGLWGKGGGRMGQLYGPAVPLYLLLLLTSVCAETRSASSLAAKQRLILNNQYQNRLVSHLKYNLQVSCPDGNGVTTQNNLHLSHNGVYQEGDQCPGGGRKVEEELGLWGHWVAGCGSEQILHACANWQGGFVQGNPPLYRKQTLN